MGNVFFLQMTSGPMLSVLFFSLSFLYLECHIFFKLGKTVSITSLDIFGAALQNLSPRIELRNGKCMWGWDTLGYIPAEQFLAL